MFRIPESRRYAVSLALVLGGGGFAGVAWETGLLLGIQDKSLATAERLLQADVILGTSAGALVGAQLGSGLDLADLYARQLSVNPNESPPRIDIAALMTVFAPALTNTSGSITQRRKTVGDGALSAPNVAPEGRKAMIASYLLSNQWPARPLRITAIDVMTGELVVFENDSGVGLVDAVTASCTVPAVWPPLTIGERQFMDGGIGSSANVDVVADYECVVMLSPTAEPGLLPFGGSLADELANHQTGPVFGIFADEASLSAFGPNILAPACRAPSAKAGRDQGRRIAPELASFLAVD
jgi:NTE family protein